MTTTAVPTMIPALIGGEAVAARSGETIDVHNPATGELLDGFRTAQRPTSTPR